MLEKIPIKIKLIIRNINFVLKKWNSARNYKYTSIQEKHKKLRKKRPNGGPGTLGQLMYLRFAPRSSIMHLSKGMNVFCARSAIDAMAATSRDQRLRYISGVLGVHEDGGFANLAALGVSLVGLSIKLSMSLSVVRRGSGVQAEKYPERELRGIRLFSGKSSLRGFSENPDVEE